jgi:GNAT superfamily N-acetyltransferase
MLNEIEKQIRYEKCTSLEEVSDLRNQYLDHLIEPQELYLELMVSSADVYEIILNKVQIGYFFLDEEGILLEYFIIQQQLHLAEEIFKKIIAEFSIHKAFCKSFDHMLLSCCAGLQIKTSVLGVLFREYNPILGDARLKEITVRPATLEDEGHVIEVNEEVFDYDHEVLEYINKQQLLIFEKEHTSIGFGIFSRVIEGRPDFDIGMLVEKDFRSQGFGQFIIGYLADFCRKNGCRPIAGCAVENIASRRTLEKAGFVAGYRLLEFSFQIVP